MDNEPHKHHYAPCFYLRNFATDAAATKIDAVAKHGNYAVWTERSIDGVGFEEHFYVSEHGGRSVSFESEINRVIETPISQSETWAKIAQGRAEMLDRSDRPVLYQLVRNLESRTPHFQATIAELAEMANDPTAEMPFTDEERIMFAAMRSRPTRAKAAHNAMAASQEWSARLQDSSGISILRSEVPFRSSTTPVLALPVSPIPKIWLPLPGMVPTMYVLSLTPHAMVCLTLGDFDGSFESRLIDADFTRGINQRFAAQFSLFPHVRHLITDRQHLIEDMTWAGFDLMDSTETKIRFRRRPKNQLEKDDNPMTSDIP